MRATKALVAVSAAMYAAFGLHALALPASVADMIHVTPRDATALNEIRAMHGGVELGLAAFLVSCLLGRWSLHAGLFLVALLFTGAAAARAKSMLDDGMPDPLFVGIWLFEIAWAAACTVVLSRKSS